MRSFISVFFGASPHFLENLGLLSASDLGFVIMRGGLPLRKAHFHRGNQSSLSGQEVRSEQVLSVRTETDDRPT
jgi:hypothetical protein